MLSSRSYWNEKVEEIEEKYHKFLNGGITKNGYSILIASLFAESFKMLIYEN